MKEPQPATRLDDSPREPQGTVAGAMAVAKQLAQKPVIAPEDYKPEPIPLSETNHHVFGGKFIQFPLKTIVQQYYAPHRFLGYLSSAMYGTMVNGFEKAGNRGGASPANRADNASVTEAGGDDQKSSTVQVNTDKFYNDFKGIENNPNVEFSKEIYEDKDKVKKKGEKITLLVESIAFTGLSLFYADQDMKKLIEDNRSHLAVEFDKNPSNVNAFDVLNSKNNMLNVQANKWVWRTASHTGSGLAYLPGLAWGLAASAANITLERFMISNETAYDLAEKLISKVQLNHLSGEVTKETVVNDLQNIMQQMRIDHNFDSITSNDFEIIRPLLAKVADDIMSKKINLPMLVDVIGGGNIIPGKLEQSEMNYHYATQRIIEKDPDRLEQTTRHASLRESAEIIRSSTMGHPAIPFSR